MLQFKGKSKFIWKDMVLYPSWCRLLQIELKENRGILAMSPENLFFDIVMATQIDKLLIFE